MKFCGSESYLSFTSPYGSQRTEQETYWKIGYIMFPFQVSLLLSLTPYIDVRTLSFVVFIQDMTPDAFE
jgi:hypothetical protein